jgi:hypothetical protein
LLFAPRAAVVAMAYDDDDDLFSEEFDFVDEDDDAADKGEPAEETDPPPRRRSPAQDRSPPERGRGRTRPGAPTNRRGRGASSEPPPASDEQVEPPAFAEEPLDDLSAEQPAAAPAGPPADHVVHIYEFGKLKRTIPRKFTDEEAVGFAEEYTRTGKAYGRYAVATPEDEEPAPTFAGASRGR